MKRYQIEDEIHVGQGGQLYNESGEIIDPKNIVKQGIGAWMCRGDGQ